MKKTVLRILLLLLCIGLFYVPAPAAELPSEITAAETPADLKANDPSLTEATVAEAPAYTADSDIQEDTEGPAADSPLSPSDEFVGAVTRTGWVKEGGKTYYYDAAGNKVTGWYQIGDVKPYFYPEDGHMATGWDTINGKRYYFYEDGSRATGFIDIDGQKYFLTQYGRLQYGWIAIGNVKPYFYPEDGHMATGWNTINGYTYYFYEDGSRAKGWTVVDGYKPYFDKTTGRLATGWNTINGYTYYFYSDGQRAKGWTVVDGYKPYFDKDNGRLATGLCTINGYTYLFDAKGHRTIGWAAVSGEKRYFDQNGRLLADTKVPFIKYLDIMSTSGKTNQIIMVVGHTLTLYNKVNGKWTEVLSSYCGYGLNGYKLASERREGDKTTPIGSFPLPLAFGLGKNPGTSMTYRQITKNSYWSGEYDTYNTWVESSSYMSGEHLIDYAVYKYAMAIGFNMDPVVYKRGSAIFLHCKSPDHWYTAGCVSVPEDVMLDLLKKTKNGAYIVTVPTRSMLKNY